MDDDLKYYEMRARQEAEAAASSDVSEAVIVHRHLAAQYEAQAFMLRPSRELISETAEAETFHRLSEIHVGIDHSEWVL